MHNPINRLTPFAIVRRSTLGLGLWPIRALSGFHRAKIAIAVFVLTTTLAACKIVPSGSMGFDIVWFPFLQGAEFSSFNLKYDNKLQFGHDLTSSVDNVFARAREGDTDAIKIAAEFLTPGFTVLQEHGIPLEAPPPHADSAKRRLIFNTDWSDWVVPRPKDGRSICVALADVASCNWQAQLKNAYAEFNPLTPAEIALHAELEIRVRVFDNSGRSHGPGIDRAGLRQLSSALEGDLLKRYYTFLKRRGVDVDSPAFRSFHEHKH